MIRREIARTNRNKHHKLQILEQHIIRPFRKKTEKERERERENKLAKMVIIKQMNLSWFTEIVPTATGKHPAENKRASLSLSSLICTTKSISTSLICTKLDISFIKERI